MRMGCPLQIIQHPNTESLSRLQAKERKKQITSFTEGENQLNKSTVMGIWDTGKGRCCDDAT